MKKFTDFVKTHIKLSLGVGAAAIAILIVAVLLISSGGATPWSESIASDIPEFGGEAVEYRAGDGYVAAYYGSVHSEAVSEYINELERELGVKFGGDGYPRTAVTEKQIIVVHYSATEQQLSVTVTNKG